MPVNYALDECASAGRPTFPKLGRFLACSSNYMATLLPLSGRIAQLIALRRRSA